MDYVNLADHICERVSIGQVIASPLDADRDPDNMPEFAAMSDDEFQKKSLKYFAERDVFAFSTILSLNWAKNKGRKQPGFLRQIQDYAEDRAQKHCNKGVFEDYKRILSTKNVGLLMAERMLNLPASVVPTMHTELPADLAFTKEQDDIKDPKEFNYDYLLILSRYTVPVKQKESVKGPGTAADDIEGTEKLYYKWEDTVLLPQADVSFQFKAEFRFIDDDGKKQCVTGSMDGKEVQYRLIYLIKYDNYLREIKKLPLMVA